MARVVVIGANGFLGSHLVDELHLNGHEVSAFDRFSSNQSEFQSPVAQLRGDFLNQTDMQNAIAGQQYVFHFLSMTTPASVENEPRLDIRTNVTATLDLLDACVAAGVERFFFASSGGAVYGNQGRSEYSEDQPTQPVSPYGIGKVAIENYLNYYRVQHDLQSTVLRISNPYGPRQNPLRRQGLIPIALGNILVGEPVHVFGDGSMTRDYAYVTDIVQMIGRLVGHAPLFGTYNLGSGTGHTVLDVLQRIRSVVGMEFEMRFVDPPPTFVDHVVLNTRRYEEEFGAPKRTALDDGIERSWEYVSQLRSEELPAPADSA
jgi:UDP-glucose 4-epimerase